MKAFYRFLTFILIVGLGIMITVGMVMHKPETKKKPITMGAPLVEVTEAVLSDEPVIITAMGTVTAPLQVAVQPQVSGKIIWQSSNLVPGSYLMDGDVMVKIDPRDYQLVVEQSKASFKQSEEDLKLEMGRQVVAKREWELLQTDIKTTAEGRELVLRKPQLETAYAELNSARSTLEKAELDLERTVIRAPFNAMVLEETADIGQIVDPGQSVATLIGTDKFRIIAAVPFDQLKWIDIPGPNTRQGAIVKVIYEGNVRTGQVVSLLGDVDSKGRMARLLVEVEDPFNLKGDSDSQPLLLGSYVRLAIQGRQAKDVYVLPQKAFRNDGEVWVMKDRKLEIRKAELIWSNDKEVMVRGDLAKGEKIIVSRISTPVDGMAVKVLNGVASANNLTTPEITGISDRLGLRKDQMDAVMPLLRTQMEKRRQILENGNARELKKYDKQSLRELKPYLDKQQMEKIKAFQAEQRRA